MLEIMRISRIFVLREATFSSEILREATFSSEVLRKATFWWSPVYEWSKACTHGCERLRARDRIPFSAPMFCEANPVVHLREMSVRHLLTKAYQ